MARSSLRDLKLFTHRSPALKRWAKLVRPSGAGFQVSPPLLNEHMGASSKTLLNERWLGASSKTLESHSTLNDITPSAESALQLFYSTRQEQNGCAHLYLYRPNVFKDKNVA